MTDRVKMASRARWLVSCNLALILVCCIVQVYGKKKKKSSTALTLQSKETSVGGFVSLLAVRLLYGLASWAGLGEWASNIFGGAFKPPGSDYDDYFGDYGADYKDDYDGGDDDYY